MVAAFEFAFSGGRLDVSPTVATLDVRGELSTLRRIASRGDIDPLDISEELARLEAALVDAFLRFDGYIPSADHEMIVERLKDVEMELDDEIQAREKAEERLETYQQTDEGTIEQVLAKLLKDEIEHDTEIALMRTQVKTYREQSDRLRSDAAAERRESEAMKAVFDALDSLEKEYGRTKKREAIRDIRNLLASKGVR